jgi:hypothetical protein
LDTTAAELAACFDICLGKESLAFVQYPYDAEAECHKGFAFVVLNRNSDVAICMAKRYRSWFYVEGKPSQGGFNVQGRAYLRLRPAHVEACHPKKDEATHLIFSPKEEGVGLRDFKLAVEDLVKSLGVTIVASEGVLDGKHKYVHIHTVDAESAAVVKMFAHQFKENDITMLVRYARQPKVVAATATAVASTATAKPAPEKSFVLEPITEQTASFGRPYAAAASKAIAPAVHKPAVVNKPVTKAKPAPAKRSAHPDTA